MLLIFLRRCLRLKELNWPSYTTVCVCVCVLSPQVKSVHCKAGETVGEGDLLVELE